MRFLSMAAIAVMAAMMTGCLNEEIPDEPQPEEATKTVTLTTTISLEGGVGTRALTAGGVKTFAEDDQITFVYKNTSGQTKAVDIQLAGSDISDDGKSASIRVTMDSPAENGRLRLIYPSNMAQYYIANDATIDDDEQTIDYYYLRNGQDGFLGRLGKEFDLAVFDGTMNGDQLPDDITLANKLAVCAFTIKNDDGSKDISSTITEFTVSDGSNTYTINRSSGVNAPIYVAMIPVADASIELTATDEDGQHYTKSLTGKTYAANNLYPLGMRMTESFKTYSTLPVGTHLNVGDQLDLSGSYFLINGDVNETLENRYAPYTLVRANVDGSTVTEAADGTLYLFKDKNGDYYGKNAGLLASAASDGIFVSMQYGSSYTMLTHVNLANMTSNYSAHTYDCLYGTLANEVKISIVDGAVVWLGGVSINADGAWTNTDHAGITCLGDATINLIDGTTNTVQGFGIKTAGIETAYEYYSNSYTLTIRGGYLGTGELFAIAPCSGAGIGTGYGSSSGNIIIEGGIVNASSNYGAGIGSGMDSRCWDITISGGTVTATGCTNAAGIGTGENAGCGSINVQSGTVTATGGTNAAGIGTGEKGYCGSINVQSGTVTANKGSNGVNDIGLGKDGEFTDDRDGVTVDSSVRTSSGGSYSGNPSSGYNHN